METVWFWILLLLIFAFVFALPVWPYTRERGPYRRGGGWNYAPSGCAAIAIILIILLFWLGFLAIWWPWYTVPA